MEEPSGAQLLGPVEIRALAEKLDVTPTKKLGQNFVHDPNTVRRIVAAAELTPDDHVVEVGPGLGSLTLALVESAASVTAVEIDPRLAAELPETFQWRAPALAHKLSIVLKDALKVQQSDMAVQPTALVANLPYNVSVPVLLHMMEEFPTINKVLVMVQAEVADHLAADPGSKIYGVSSLKASFYGPVTRAGSIGKNVFWPAPKIESGLVKIVREDTAWKQDDETRKKVWPIIDAAFLQRRKTLRAALSGHYGSGQAAEEALRAADIDPTLRGEKLDVTDYVRLAGVLQQKDEK